MVILDVGVDVHAKQIRALTTSDLAHIDGSFRVAPSQDSRARHQGGRAHCRDRAHRRGRVGGGGGEVEIHPAPSTIRTIQDKSCQKVHLQSHSLPIAPFLDVEPTIHLSYDGRCVQVSFSCTLTVLKRPNSRERIHTSTSQLGTLHHRSLRDFTIRDENHLRAIFSLPIGSTTLKVPFVAMLNLGSSNDMSELVGFAEFALGVPGSSVHLYCKEECRKGRKTGHIIIAANSDAKNPNSSPPATATSSGRNQSRKQHL